MAKQIWTRTYFNTNKFTDAEAFKKWFYNGGSKKEALMRLDYVDMYKPPRTILVDGKKVNNPEYRRFYRGTEMGKATVATWREDNREHIQQYDKADYQKNRQYYLDKNKQRYRIEKARLNTIKNMDWLEYFKQDKAYLNKISKAYQITVEQIIAMYENGKCEICGMTNKRHLELYEQRLHIDHEHYSGEVRGLLCSHHNAMIGWAGDDTLMLKKGIEYIKKHDKRIKKNREDKKCSGKK
jgi:hypothetical protein